MFLSIDTAFQLVWAMESFILPPMLSSAVMSTSLEPTATSSRLESIEYIGRHNARDFRYRSFFVPRLSHSTRGFACHRPLFAAVSVPKHTSETVKLHRTELFSLSGTL